MKKIRSVQRYQTEKAIIDALLKISEIIKKTTRTNQHSKNTIVDGDTKQLRKEYDYDEIYNVRTPHSHRSYVNQNYNLPSVQRSSNCIQTPIILWKTRSHNKRYDSTVQRQRIHDNNYDREFTYKHRYCDPSSSSSEMHHQKRSSRYHPKQKSSESTKSRRFRCKCQSLHNDNNYNISDCE
ncbi:unnamed protein product [Adineta steineri]|uniref:Uncharacterized protein n=1 Tax=Adineta steineri TaxID=433720 RepID=A0A819B9G1_9BILA|nr:unnamed protein product [Adineta steineri]